MYCSGREREPPSPAFNGLRRELRYEKYSILSDDSVVIRNGVCPNSRLGGRAEKGVRALLLNCQPPRFLLFNQVRDFLGQIEETAGREERYEVALFYGISQNFKIVIFAVAYESLFPESG